MLDSEHKVTEMAYLWEAAKKPCPDAPFARPSGGKDQDDRGHMRQHLAALSILVLLSTAGPSWAALGRPVESVAVDQQRLQGERRSLAGEGFQVEEIASADGTLVREYVAPTGEVFGVSWRGPAVPDLALLLGDYLAEFRGAARSTTRRHRPLVVRTERLVVEMGGHVRALHGRAYLPGSLPDTVSQAVVR